MTFWYLATPYKKYPSGPVHAFKAACQQAMLLTKAGVPVFSPIVHTHPMSMFCDIDPHDNDFWLKVDEPFMRAAIGLIICKLPSWEQSDGIKREWGTFESAGKPVVRMEPDEVPAEILRWLSSSR